MQDAALRERIDWTAEDRFVLADTNFLSTIYPDVYHAKTSNADEFLIVKSREMLETELRITSGRPLRNILDIGIWQGGSVAYLDCMFEPEKLVALDFSPQRIEPLDAFVERRGRAENVKLHYGVNQADQATVTSIIEGEFADKTIDLIIDDASHQYEETKASFNVLFPRMTKGGVFLIEDWQWSVSKEVAEMDYFEGKKGLANLLLQCMLVAGRRPDLISEVIVMQSVAAVIRGTGDLTEGDLPFDIDTLATNRGVPVDLVL